MAHTNINTIVKRLVAASFLVLLPLFILFYIQDSKNFNLPIPKYYPIVKGNDTIDYHRIPTFSFIDNQNKIYNDDSLRGNVHVAYFFFTRCGTICPKITENVKILQKELSVYKNIKLVGYTVDPSYDDYNVLRRHALKHDMIPSTWRLLTGDAQDIYRLAKDGYKISAQEAPDGSIEFVHSDRLVLVDREGIIRGFCDGTDAKAVERFATEVLHVHLSYTRDGKESIFH